MIRTTVKVEGLRELDRALGELTKGVGTAVLRKVGTAALRPMADRMVELAPDDPVTQGNDLRSSITVSTKLTRRQAAAVRKAKKAGEGSYVEVYAGPGGIAHAVPQEFGTVNHPPQPYVRPAWDEQKQATLERVKDGLGPEITKAAERAAKRALKAKGGTGEP